mgnify:CR=1 FL=1
MTAGPKARYYSAMKRKSSKRCRGLPALILYALASWGCASEPSSNGTDLLPPEEAVPQAVISEDSAPAEFNPQAVSAELKESTLVDISGLIETLNTIIRRKDYDAWIPYLTEEYIRYYSSAEVLGELSQQPALRRYNIVLRSLRDYFNYVVYPSRQNARVDDIEFVDEKRIVAITISTKEERLVLYNLEKINDTWKIAIWR